MITTYDQLRADPNLRALLSAYGSLKRHQPAVDWHDRVMELPEATSDELNRLHGLLLASGWIETRVHGDSFQQAGRLQACYRITTDGNAALRLTSPGHIPDDESEQVLFQS